MFDPAKLAALRELALGWLAERGLGPAAAHSAAQSVDRPGPVVVALAPGNPAEHVVRRAAELAAARHAGRAAVVCPAVGLSVAFVVGQDEVVDAAARSSREANWPRRSALLVRVEKNSSTWFSQLACLGA